MRNTALCAGKTVEVILENGSEVEFVFECGTHARFDWLDENGDPIKGKLRCKSVGTHIHAKTAVLKKVAQQ